MGVMSGITTGGLKHSENIVGHTTLIAMSFSNMQNVSQALFGFQKANSGN